MSAGRPPRDHAAVYARGDAHRASLAAAGPDPFLEPCPGLDAPVQRKSGEVAASVPDQAAGPARTEDARGQGDDARPTVSPSRVVLRGNQPSAINLQLPASAGADDLLPFTVTMRINPGSPPVVEAAPVLALLGRAEISAVPTGARGTSVAALECSRPGGPTLYSEPVTFETAAPSLSSLERPDQRPPGSGDSQPSPAPAARDNDPSNREVAPSFVATTMDLGKRIVTNGPGPFQPVWIIRPPGQQAAQQLSFSLEPTGGTATERAPFNLGAEPPWMRFGETSAMATAQFAPATEGTAQADLVMQSGPHQSRLRLIGEGLVDVQPDVEMGQGTDGLDLGGDGGKGRRGPGSMTDVQALAAATELQLAIDSLYDSRLEMVRLIKDEARTEDPALPTLSQHEADLLADVAWLAFHLVSAGTSKYLASLAGSAGKFVEGLVGDAVKLGAGAAQASFRLSSDENGKPVVLSPVAHRNSAVSNNMLLAYFYSQLFALGKARASRLPLGTTAGSFAATGISYHSARKEIQKVAKQSDLVQAQQARTTTAGWFSFLAQRAIGAVDGTMRLDNDELSEFDSKLHVPRNAGVLLDIGVLGRRVVSARSAGTTSTLTSRLYKLNLIEHRVPFRVFEAGLNSYSVVRNEAGQLRITGDVRRFASYGGGLTEGLSDDELQREGARILVEELVGSRSLSGHGVTLAKVGQ